MEMDNGWIRSAGSAPNTNGIAKDSGIALGDCTLRPNIYRLERAGVVHKLEPNQQAVLLELIGQAPNIVSHEALIETHWSGLVVGDNVLHQAIAALRRALGDNARSPTYIETLPKRGYRWIGPVPERSEAVAPFAENEQERDKLRSTRTTRRAWLVGIAVLCLGALAVVGRSLMPDLPEKPLVLADFVSQSLPVLSIAEFENLSPTTLTAEALRGHAESFTPYLVNSKTIALTADAARAQFTLRGSVEVLATEKRTRLELIETSEQRPVWSRAFVQPLIEKEFVQAPVVVRLIEAVTSAIDFERLSVSRGFDEIAAREHSSALIAWNQLSLGAGGNGLVVINHLRNSMRRVPEFWGPYQLLAILLGNRLGLPASLDVDRQLALDAANDLFDLRPLHGMNTPVVEWNFVFALVSVRLYLDYDFAEEMFLRARELGWNAGQIDAELGAIYLARGQLGTARRYFEAAMAGDAQLNQTPAQFSLSYTQLAAGQTRAAIRTLKRMKSLVGIDTSYAAEASARLVLAMSMLDDPSAKDVLDTALQTTSPKYANLFAGPLAAVGEVEEARKILDDMARQFKAGPMRRTWPAVLGHVELGDHDAAFLWLNRAIENREVEHIWEIKMAPYLDPLRADPRFDQALMRLQEIESEGSPLRALAATVPSGER